MTKHTLTLDYLPDSAIELTGRVIDALGGTMVVCETLGIQNHTVVSKWRMNGVSPNWAADLAYLAGMDPHELRPDHFHPWPKDPDKVKPVMELDWSRRRARTRSDKGKPKTKAA